ncbi:hypothetical protein Cob_v011620 [Colletotrichum orbiculare MAFF 240422]|uniref:Uncharacterized protein n=1 Tax=Colletotrichum orbiculare (strain 104-T / ATCC 96160 / CBS 514.97 / LARS 414 / MAFF 240422) TaxID=1213857 RepID=N4URE2_COLOR|nr:hypothetical protein Cob_v011620 [Colletotrichum orbiculare MAFF 240422]
MNTTTVARRQLPLLLLSRTPTASSSQWQSCSMRGFATDGPDDGIRNRPRKKKDATPSIFEEIFPNDDITTLSRPRNATKVEETPKKDQVKLRYLTSTTDKSEVTEYRAKRRAHHEETKKWAASQIPGLLNPKAKTSPATPPPGPTDGKWGAFYENKTAPSTTQDIGDEAQAEVNDDGPPSLFDELFKTDEVPTHAASATSDRVSLAKGVDHNDLQSWIDSLAKEQGDDTAEAADKPRPALLILSNASANLAESDFYRVGPQGQHLDGWSASIRKVLQAYDYNNLQPMGRYFILFDSHVAAASYQAEAQRRHTLARRALASPAAPIAVNPESALRNDQIFTLAPPSKAPLSLHLYKLNKATETRLQTFNIQGLLSMTPDPPPRAGSHVVLSLAGGTLDQRTLTQWIRRDARDRNLGWPVQHLRPYFPPKVNRRRVAEAVVAEHDFERTDDSPPPPPPSSEPASSRGDPGDETARSMIFVLSFPDVHEARRFVRAWHRKELIRPRGPTVTVNTHFVW